MAENSKARKILQPLGADIRQALVGWIVLLSLPLFGALLLTTLAGEVPAWTLAAVLMGAVVLLVATSLEHRRAQGRVEGILEAETEHRERLEVELADMRSDSDPQVQSNAREGLLFRIDTLREEVIDRLNSGLETTTGQGQALYNLAKDVRDQCGQSAMVDQVAGDWESPIYGRSSTDAAAALGQLRGVVMSAPISKSGSRES